jgi:cation:H+ antiporter
MIGSSLLFVFFFRDMLITWAEGLGLFLLFLGYTGFNVLMAGKEPNREVIQLEDETLPGRMNHWSLELLSITGGLVFLVIGANLLVKSAVSMAQTFGVSEAIIGLTIVAIGTSLPELATSVVAAMHRQSEIAVGNVIGSNIFNLLCILGLAAMFSPIEGAGISPLDLWTMLISSALLLPFFWTRFELNRWEGLVLIAVYITYIVLLIDQNVIGAGVIR